MFILDFMAEVEPVSENFLYKPTMRERGVSLYKDPAIVAYQKELRDAFAVNPALDFLPPPAMVGAIVTHYLFGLPPDRYWERDLTNMIKATEDALFSKDQEKFLSVLPFDDSKVVANVQKKVFSDVYFVCVKVALLTSPDENEDDAMSQLIAAARHNPFLVAAQLEDPVNGL